MIAWTIEACKQSGCFDRVIVSSDDPEIIEISKLYGADVPFTRPADISGDITPVGQVVTHTLNWLQENEGTMPPLACLVFCNAFLQPQTLKEGLDKMIANNSNGCFVTSEYDHPIQRALYEDGNKRIKMFHPEHRNTRTQDLPSARYDAGQFYWVQSSTYLQYLDLWKDAVTITIPRNVNVDIDYPEDWNTAEVMHEVLMKVANVDAVPKTPREKRPRQ